ncbi:DMT family transporter [uncultured Sanguibacteroides sp.]|uniref:EamA family transporter n=1 Tax=uncultured Sanguibacteroides sp. TaxID=1635151 RepID=UPI0025E1CEAF|nr:DMT family transporter [uncultured Sanguibacteroides sp.]
MKQVRGVILAMISSSTFGLIPLFALPVIRDGVGLDSVLFYRFAISAFVIGSYLFFKRESFRVSGKELMTFFVLGALYASTALFLTASYLYIPSGIATTIHFLYPVLVTGIMIVFFKDRASLPVIMAACMAIAGVYLLSNGEGGGVISYKGLFMVLSTVLTYAVYIVGINKSCVRKMDGLKMTFFILFASAVVFLLNLLVKGEGLDRIPDYSAAIHLFLLALIPTLISDLTLILAIQHIGSTTTAILGCMEPLTAVCMGILFLNERFGPGQLLGVIVVLLAVFIVILATRPEGFSFKRMLPAFLLSRHK